MKKILNLGEVDYYGIGRKNCPVTIKIELRDTPNGKVLSIVGNIWRNPLHTDCVSCGQNYDTIAELFPHDKKLKRILDIWRTYHLNDMHAGTVEQETIVNGADYDKAVELLRNAGKYIVDASGYLTASGKNASNRYAYGSAWLFWPLPADIIAEIEAITY